MIGGRLKEFILQWTKLTSDKYILEAVMGYKLEFSNSQPPAQFVIPFPYKLSELEATAVDNEIKRLKEKGVIEPPFEEGGFISNVFTRPKKDGGFRMILDLSELNKSITYRHFKMDTFETAVNLLSKDCFMASIDLRDAYYSVPIAKNHRKFLKFSWGGKFWQFKALPNGLASGPRLFTKILKPPFAVLRTMGITIVAYIDDTLLIAKCKQEATEAVAKTAALLSQLGFIIHPEKSVLIPRKQITFLGFVINSNLMHIVLTPEKRIEVKGICIKLLQIKSVTIRAVASVIGKLVATFPAVEYGRLHYRELEKEKSAALKKVHGHFDRPMRISQMAKEELIWWSNNIDRAIRHINKGKITIRLTSDASGLGWGATDDNVQTGGRWNKLEKARAENNEINYLEMLAAYFALQAFCNKDRNIHVLLRLDNTTAVAYINNMGGVKSLACNEMAKIMWNWCIHRQIWITASYLPGIDNHVADRRSREFNDQLEWMLDKEIFRQCCEQFGKPEIDLFASRLNTQLDRYVSWNADPGAEAFDAFSQTWNKYYFYAFPPFSLIGRCLSKIEQEQAEGIIIVPKWPTQTWFPRLLNLLTEEPVSLPNCKNLLTQPSTGDLHPLHNQIVLLCCRLSGHASKSTDFQRKQQTLFSPHGEDLPLNNIMSILENGWIFVLKKKLIHCRQLQLKS